MGAAIQAAPAVAAAMHDPHALTPDNGGLTESPRPVAVYNASQHEYVLVYSESNVFASTQTVSAQRLDASSDPIGTPTALLDSNSWGAGFGELAASWDRASNRSLVVFVPNGGELMGLLLDSQARPVGQARPISHGSPAGRTPCNPAIYSRPGGGWVVFWQANPRDRPCFRSDGPLFAQRLAADGAPIASSDTPVTGRFDHAVSAWTVAPDPRDRGYLLAALTKDKTGIAVRGQRLSRAGRPVRGPFRILRAAVRPGASNAALALGVNPRRGGYVLARTIEPRFHTLDGGVVRLNSLDGLGHPFGRSLALHAASQHQNIELSGLTYTPSSKRFLLTWSSTYDQEHYASHYPRADYLNGKGNRRAGPEVRLPAPTQYPAITTAPGVVLNTTNGEFFTYWWAAESRPAFDYQPERVFGERLPANPG